MAVTISTIKGEVLSDLQESTTSTFLTDTNFVSFTNDFYEEYGAELELQGGPTDYTWGASTTAVPFSSVATSMWQVYRIEVLDTSGDVGSILLPRPRGHNEGFFIWNNSVYLNPQGEAPDEDTSTRWWYYRVPTAATSVSSNIDLHSGFERSVMKPWYMYKAYLKMRKFSIADGFLAMFERSMKRMKRDRYKQAKPPHDSLVVSDDYSSLTG